MREPVQGSWLMRWAELGLVALLVGCGPVGVVNHSPHDDSATRVRRLAAEHTAAYERAFPDLVEYLGGTLEHHDALPDNSLEAVSAWQAREDAWLRELKPLRFAVGSSEWLMHGLLQNTLESSASARVCRTELWPAHEFGWQSTLLTILDRQPLGTAAARAEAVARWSQLPRFLTTEMANLREGFRLGYTAPRKNVERALAQLDALLSLDESSSPFWGPMRRDTEENFRVRWSLLAREELVPATLRYRNFLRDEYAPRARTSLGITGIPNGADCYRAQIRANTTYWRTPTEVYQLGKNLVAEREAKVLELARSVFGEGIGDLRAARTALDSDPRSRFTGPEEALSFVRQAMARAQRAAPLWFKRLPRAPLELAPYQDFEAQSHPPARYEPAATDGSRPARFRIDVTHFAEIQRAEVEVTAFHEGIPGHHLQLGLELDTRAQHQAADPRGLAAYFEGWARYGEGLADEMGLYSSDLARLGAVAHLPTGLVVDPAIHALGWSRERALAWTLSKQVAFSPDEAEAYVDRIAVCPGEMLSYGFGEQELHALRREAQTALGSRFDIKEFHDQLLTRGALPLTMVREVILHWLH